MEERYNKFTSLILGISRSIQKIKNIEMFEYGLKGSHVQSIFHLYIDGGLSAKELCVVCEEDKAAISRTLKELEQKGFVYVDEKEEKRYKNIIRLTERGMLLGKDIVKKINNILNIASKGIKENEREKFYESLILVNENLQKICNSYGV